MDKPADSQFPIHELLRKRWSPRAFSDRRVEPEKLLRILEAARWAASCFNEQPWSFIVATKEEAADHVRLLDCLTERNRSWAGRAPVLMLSIANIQFENSGKPNRHALHDVGLAVGNLIVQAADLDLYTHQMAGFQMDRARKTFEIPTGQEPVAVIAVGYRGDPAELSEEFRARESAPRMRKSLESFVFSGGWNKAASWISGPR